MRIIAGTYRSRGLSAPAGMATRPTSDRLRETLFNVLAPRIEGEVFLDLYAGSGAVGLEALSRGARSATFVERAQPALKKLRANLAALGIKDGFRVHACSVSTFLHTVCAETFGVVFLDPPYDASAEYETVLGLLGGASAALLAANAIVIAEHRRKERLNDRYGKLVRIRLLEQGDAALTFYAAGGEAG
ncbi:MAG TPA: 16S rRNA (guanine(966)-N(2))-methyltransferase RsmD [Terracidiphilus sp.]|nr:16S rRNA (guanine(966)-N(2))-methyltransferase RsmD [Terracidiphilus sp.]